MNTILKDQNSDQSIRLLKAQRVEYERAKKIQLTFELISLIVALLMPLFYIFLSQYKTQAGITGSILAIIALAIDRYQKKLTKTAASIQDMFDRAVFKLHTNKFQKAENVSTDKIVRLAKKYKKDDLKDWYSKKINEHIPHLIAVILCQKANLTWDIMLRRKYRNLIWFLVVVYFFLFCAALINNCELTSEFIYDLLLLIVGGSAFIKYSVNTIAEKNDMINEKNNLNLEIDNIIRTFSETGIEPAVSDIDSIQNMIFNSRKKAIKVPDWFYYMFKNEQETEMDDVASSIINDQISIGITKANELKKK